MHIHQDQRRAPLLPDADSRRAVLGNAYRKPNGSQQLRQPTPVLRLIVDHQDSGNLRSRAYANHAAAGDTPAKGHRGVAAFDGDLEPEYGASSSVARNRDIASHQLRVFAADGQPQAGALLGVKTALRLAKRLEQRGLVRLRNARTSVLKPRRQPEPVGAPLFQSNLQLDLAAGGELDGVAEKVDQGLAYLTFVRHNVRHGFAVDHHTEFQGLRFSPQPEQD